MTARAWTRPSLVPNATLRAAIVGAMLLYLFLAIGSLDINWARIAQGFEKGWRLLLAFMHPNFGARWGEIVIGMRESLTMTVCATVAGVALSIPIGIGAARNLVHPAGIRGHQRVSMGYQHPGIDRARAGRSRRHRPAT